MKALLTLFDGAVYKFSTKTEVAADGLYEGRISEELSFLSMTSENGSTPAEQNVTIRNEDNFIPSSKNLWGAELSLTSELGQVWRGKVTFYNFDGDGNLYLTASEKGAPELEKELPDEVRQVYSIDENFHQSSTTMTIPLVVGGSHANPLLIPGILIDKTQGVYLLCTGEIREIVNVYSGSEKLNASDYTAYTGTSSQAEHKGFAYVKIAESKRQNLDGTYAEINAEVVGLKLGTHTESECRNGARFLYYLLTTPATGINGWGCGIPTSEIDQTSFNYAIQLCDTFQYRLDGIMWLRQSAQSWIDQICQAIHGTYSMNSDGKRALTIDYAAATSKRTFGADDMIVSRYGRNAYTGQVYNKGILSYGYNPVTGLFMQSAQYHNEQSIDQIGEQKFVGESYLINDAATALAVLEYTCKKSQAQSESIEFTTDRLETPLAAGDLITIDRPDIDIEGVWQISSISTSETLNTITAKRFDTSVFTVSGTHSNVNWTSEKPIEPALTPAQATDLILTSGFDINPDGTGNCFINGTFTLPAGGWLAAAVQYGEGTTPTRWIDAALITDNNFKIVPVSVGTVYSVRIRMITATGHSDYITGQITTTGDNIAPNVPTIAVNATDKSVIIQCAVEQPPYDMGGFQIYRKKHSESVYSYIGSVAANGGYASYSDYVPEFVQYDYKAKSYDRSGNLSDFSAEKTIMVTGVEANELAATALKIPTGSILNITAKGCTTESIKTAGGVIDGSGYGHHGQAFGGVSIVNDDELGQCFDFAGTNGRATVLGNLLNGCRSLTLSFRWKSSEPSSNNWVFCASVDGQAAGRQLSATATTDYFQISLYYNSANIGICRLNRNIFDNKVHLLTYTADFNSATAILYFDGEKVAEANDVNVSSDYSITANNFNIGNAWAAYTAAPHKGKISDFRIYPRALSAVEVKSLYMIPQEAVLSRVTADVIGANAINAIHLNASSVTANAVGSNQIVANTANIKDGVITNAKISTVESEKINAGNIQAGAITTEKLNVEAVKRPGGIKWELNFKGCASHVLANGERLPDSSGLQRVITARGTLRIATDTTYGQCMGDFNSNNYIEIRYNSGNLSSMTFDFIYGGPAPTGSQVMCIVDCRKWSTFKGFCIYRKAGILEIGGNVSTVLNVPYTSTAYNRITVVANNSATYKCKVFINGVLVVQTTSQIIAGADGLDTTYIGKHVGGADLPLSGGWINYIGFYNRALSDTEVKTLYMLGTDTESGQITADRIATDAIKSRNYSYSSGDFSTAGTFLDLANGAITSQNFCIKSDGSAKFKGDITGASGTFSGALSGATGSFSGSITATSGKIGGWSILSDGSIKGTFSGTALKTSIQAYVSDSMYAKLDYTGLTAYNVSTGGKSLWIDTAAGTSGGVNSTIHTSGNGHATLGWSSGSDRAVKSKIKSESVLNRLKEIDLPSWHYDDDKLDKAEGKISRNLGTKAQPKHYGPMAQEFNAVFGTSDGASDFICYTDTIGVALRAIQELAQQLDDLKRQVRIYKRILNITDEQIAQERDKTAIRKLEIAKARQAKRAIREHESPIELEEVEDVEINIADSDDTNA